VQILHVVLYQSVPLYPRTKASASAPSNVSKSVDQQVSKGADSQSESLTSAQVRENVGDEQLRIELEKYAKILKEYETFGKEQKDMKQTIVLQAEKWRKPDAKQKGEYDEKKAALELKRLDALEAEKRAREAGRADTVSDVEPDDPVPTTIDENANVVKDDEEKIALDALGIDDPSLAKVASNVDAVIISSDENDGANSGKDAADDDVDLNMMGAEIAENLWGVVFDIPDDANLELGLKHPSRVERVDDFGVHELNWQPTLSEMWMDVTDGTDDEGHNVNVAQNLRVRPDSTMENDTPRNQADMTVPVHESPPRDSTNFAEIIDTQSLDDMRGSDIMDSFSPHVFDSLWTCLLSIDFDISGCTAIFCVSGMQGIDGSRELFRDVTG